MARKRVIKQREEEEIKHCRACGSKKLRNDFMCEDGERIKVKVCKACSWWG